MKAITIDSTPTTLSFSHQSKGNQWKWYSSGYWYKADHFGYEALAEITVSEFLKCSNLGRTEYVCYEPVVIHHKGEFLTGCVSPSFLCKDAECQTFEKIYRANTATSLAGNLGKLTTAKERISHAVDFMSKITGIEDFGRKLTATLEVDALFLNEDRHTNNLSLIYEPHCIRPRFAPIYDNGAALFSDTRLSFPVNLDYEACLKKYTSKPFCEDPDEQLEIAQSLYGSTLHFDLSAFEARKLFMLLVEKYELDTLYAPEIIQRVDETLRMQIRKYSHMFN